jgi:hypothetical protein
MGAQYSVGDAAKVRPNLVVNDAALRRPTLRPISATVRSVVRRRAPPAPCGG